MACRRAPPASGTKYFRTRIACVRAFCPARAFLRSIRPAWLGAVAPTSSDVGIVAELTLERLMAFEVDSLCGAARHERSGSRINYRNGYRARALDTRLGTLELRIPKRRHLLPAIPRAAQDVRAGARRGRPGCLDRSRLHPARRRAGPGSGQERDQQVAGLEALPPDRRGGRELPQ